MRSFTLFLTLLALLWGLGACAARPTPQPLPFATLAPTQQPTHLPPTPLPTLHAPGPELISACRSATEGMYGLISGLEIPDHFNPWNEQEAVRTGSEFDVNSYFAVLPHIAMEPGYTLDYVYSTALGNGYPVLYARRQETERYATFSDYEHTLEQAGTEGRLFWSRLGDMLNDDTGDTSVDYDLPDETYLLLHQGYLSHVTVDDSESGYFQLVLLYLAGDQFYLQWHANYDDETVVCDTAGFEKILSNLGNGASTEDPQIQQMRAALPNVTLAPSIVVQDEVVEIQLSYFTKWGGLFRGIYQISRKAPHVILETNRMNLLKYDCGIRMF